MEAEIGIEYESFVLEGFDSFGIQGRHTYIVYTDTSGKQYVLEGGLYDESPVNITVRSAQLFRGDNSTAPSGLIAKPIEAASTYVKLDIESSEVVSVWSEMLEHATAIEEAQIPYVLSPGPNSNSVAASILNDAGFDVIQLLNLKLPEDISSTNAMSYAMSGQTDFFSIGFMGATNTLESITSGTTLGVAEAHLLSYGVSMQLASEFIMSHISSLEIIHDTCKQYGVTNDMIAEILADEFPGVTGAVVANYFTDHGIDSTDLGGSLPTIVMHYDMF